MLLGDLSCLGLPRCTVIGLVDVVDGEVLGIDGSAKLGLEGSMHLSDPAPVDTGKVWMLFDLGCTVRTSDMTNAVGRVA
jgi:hypothetical protein